MVGTDRGILRSLLDGLALDVISESMERICKSGTDDLAEPLDNLGELLRRRDSKLLSNPFNSECPDLTDLDPGTFGQIL